MIGKTELTKLSLLLHLLIVILAAATPAAGYSSDYDYYAVNEKSYFNQLILNIYVDEAGKAVVMGYVEDEDRESLSFLKTAEYLYENETKQLYALTNALTSKYGENWEINFTTETYYTEYHTIFYLPGDVRLGRITCSEGLGYFVTVSGESFVIDVQGYDVENPRTAIEYQQPFREAGVAGISISFRPGYLYLLLIIALSALTLALGIALARMKRREDARDIEAAAKAEVKRGELEIELTSEMARVMETLTDRERAIVTALLKHNGEITQADLRYETGIPKSSLTGILRSLERRKIINKKEWGRTNVIELSKWFLTKKEQR
ncbi:MAG: hypothetical protein IBX41_08755 [Methanophagales archaeon]|nr:hypothetical protein [Methanophagales archaeon]